MTPCLRSALAGRDSRIRPKLRAVVERPLQQDEAVPALRTSPIQREVCGLVVIGRKADVPAASPLRGF